MNLLDLSFYPVFYGSTGLSTGIKSVAPYLGSSLLVVTVSIKHVIVQEQPLTGTECHDIF